MKKQLTVILLSALLLSGCASGRMGNPGALLLIWLCKLIISAAIW